MIMKNKMSITNKVSTTKKVSMTNKLTGLRYAGMFLSLILVAFSLTGLFTKGLDLGIDFTGGFISEFTTSDSIEQSRMERLLEDRINGKFQLTSSQTGTHWIVRQPDNADGQSTQTWSQVLQQTLKTLPEPIQMEVLDSDYLGTQAGNELMEQGGMAMLTALLIILLYLSTRFEWRFALGAILALLHDVIFVLGVFAWTQLEFNLTVLASLLAIIGYSLNDSIIVADRIRELMKQTRKFRLPEVINSAIKSTIARTLVTSGTTLGTITSIWWLAGKPLEGFAVALFSGVIVGTLSSICISATFPEISGIDGNYYQNKARQDQELGKSP